MTNLAHADEGSMVSRPALQSESAGSTPAARSTLRVAPCDHKAAEYAVMHWHYSKAMPMPPLVKFGAWEDERFIGAVIFGRGGNRSLGAPYGLGAVEVCELVRVALREHEHPVSEVVAASMKVLRRTSPGVRLVVSFADPRQGHRGGIYQAGNWLYLGVTATAPRFLLPDGKLVHRRTLDDKQFGQSVGVRAAPKGAQRVRVPGKHRYVYPLDKAMRRKLTPKALPYPAPITDSRPTAAAR